MPLNSSDSPNLDQPMLFISQLQHLIVLLPYNNFVLLLKVLMIVFGIILCVYVFAVTLLLFLTFSANFSVFAKDQSCRLTWTIWCYGGAWIQPNVGCISRSKCIKSLKVWIWKELFQLVISTFHCNAKEYEYKTIHFILYTSIYISSEKNIRIVGSVLLPSLLQDFVKLQYKDMYFSRLENYPCPETQSFYLKKGQ